MYVSSRRGSHGLGDQATQYTSATMGVAASILALAPATSIAAPFVAAAAGLVALFGQIFSGCGQTCIQATQYANQAGAQLDQLKAQYFAQPVHYRSSQLAFLQAFDQIVAWLKQMCGNPQLGDAGRRCISERLVPGGTAPWCPTQTGCDYYATFRDPVANDPNVVPDPSPVSQFSAGINSVVGSFLPPQLGSSTLFGIPRSGLLLPAALILGGLILMEQD